MTTPNQNLEEICKNLIMLSAMTKEGIDKQISRTEQSTKSIEYALESTKVGTKEFLDKTEKNIAYVMKNSIESSMKESSEAVSKDFKAMANILLNAADDFNGYQKSLVKQTKWLSWKALFVMFLAIFIIIGVSTKYSYDEYQKYLVLSETNKELQKSIERKHIILRTNVTLCGDKPCIKLDEQMKPWTSGKDQYFIIDEQ